MEGNCEKVQSEMLTRVREIQKKESRKTIIASSFPFSQIFSLEVLLEQHGDLVVDLQVGIHRPGEVQMREAWLLIHVHDVAAGLGLYEHRPLQEDCRA